ncbi:MAG: hypothetical protein R3C03_02735 [Pirellulaceae bacterium]
MGGIYGVAHDQITYSISPEYFTKLKFKQFAYADFGLGNRFFAGTIGFIATWWVGFAAAWFLARKHIPKIPRGVAIRQIFKSVLVVVLFAVIFAFGGFAYISRLGTQSDISWWSWAFRKYQIDDHWNFVRVAYIHNSGYVGAFVGLIFSLVVIRRVQGQAKTQTLCRQIQKSEEMVVDEATNP